MKQTEKGTVEIIFREFTQAYKRISGNMVIIDPDLLAWQIEMDQHPDMIMIPKRNDDEVIASECSDILDLCDGSRPAATDGLDPQVYKREKNSCKS